MGNSFVQFQFQGILKSIKESKQNFSKAYLMTYPACTHLAGELNVLQTKWRCPGFDYRSYDKLLEVLRPDLIIHTGR